MVYLSNTLKDMLSAVQNMLDGKSPKYTVPYVANTLPFVYEGSAHNVLI